MGYFQGNVQNHPTNANWQDVYIVAQWDGGPTFSNHNGLFGGTASGDSGLHGNSDSPGTNLGSGWFDNFYLNGSASTTTTGVINTMSSPFTASISKDSAVSATGYKVGFDRVWSGRMTVDCRSTAFNTKLSDLDRKKVQTYLSQKWNISIPSESTNLLVQSRIPPETTTMGY